MTLTYTQNFDCCRLAGKRFYRLPNHIRAGLNPGEMQTTQSVVVQMQPTINPPGQIGDAADTTAPLYVLVPMFSSRQRSESE